MNALVTRFLGSPVVSRRPIPSPTPHEILIKVAFVSLNPTDYKHASLSLPPSKIVGCDFSGTVEKLGSSVSDFGRGDRIGGIIHGCKNSHTGAFAEYIVADPYVCYHVPRNVSLERACTIGVGWVSAMQAVHQQLHNESKNDTLLIYSAATNTGMHAIQFSRIIHPNTSIVAIASPKHHEMLRSLGADAVFDYRSPSLVKDVKALGKEIRRSLDCYSEGNSSATAAACMAGGRLVRTLPPSMMSGSVPKEIETDWILSYTALGKPFWFLLKYYSARPEDYKNAHTYLQELTKLLEQGKFVPVPHRLMSGGLSGIQAGFNEMQAGKVRGEKLVYEVGGEVDN